MDKTQLVSLIINRSPKLRSLREQTANSNQQKKGLFVLALKHLLEDRRTQEPAYEEITELLASGSLFVANTVNQQLANTIIRQHCQNNLDEYIILWGRMLDGVLAKKSYPNLKKRLQNIKIKYQDRELSTKLNNYLTLFQKNFNQRNDQRVQFFQDFDDSVVSESMDNNSQRFEVFYLNIMEIKAARKKLEQKIPDEALNQQLNKLKYFLSLEPPRFLSQNQYAEYQKQCDWARKFLQNRQNQKNNNSSVSINQTLQLQGEVQEIEIINKEPKPRMFKQAPLNRQFFEDSIQMSEKPEENHISFKNVQVPTPVKMIDDPRYVQVTSRNNSLEIHNGHRFQHFQQLNSPQVEENKQAVEEQLVIHKIKPQTVQPFKAKQIPDFSVTENYFSKKNEPMLTSPRTGIQSQTLDRWGAGTCWTPTKLSRCKLSKFTSQKKARKQVATKDQLSASEPYVIQPYLQHFQTIKQFARFRRNCFDKSITIIGSKLVTVNCLMQKEINSKIRVEISFVNNTNLPLQLQTVYKIPKCFAIEKRSKVSKRFTLHNHLKHIFCLDVQEFPLEPCLISIRSKPNQTLIDVVQTQVAFPLTLLNFVEYLCITEEEWSKEWKNIGSKQSNRLFYSAKHIEVDKQVIGEEIDWLLKDTFVRISSIEGYSVQDYGCICFYQGLQNLKFILRLSVRVDNIVSLEMISCRPTTKNQQQFLDYCLNLWMMLLGKLYV